MTDFTVVKPTEPAQQQIGLEPALRLFEGADSLLTIWECWQADPQSATYIIKVRQEIVRVQQLLDICKSLTVN
jgi:hypothetical protein